MQHLRDEEINLNTFSVLRTSAPLSPFQTPQSGIRAPSQFESHEMFFSTVEQGLYRFLGGGIACVRREEGFSPEQIPRPAHHAAAEITQVTSLVLWKQSAVDESPHMMEGRAVFRQEPLSEVPKEFKVAETPEGTSKSQPQGLPLFHAAAETRLSHWEGKAAHCWRSQGGRGFARGACPPALPLGNRANADPRRVAGKRNSKSVTTETG